MLKLLLKRPHPPRAIPTFVPSSNCARNLSADITGGASEEEFAIVKFSGSAKATITCVIPSVIVWLFGRVGCHLSRVLAREVII